MFSSPQAFDLIRSVTVLIILVTAGIKILASWLIDWFRDSCVFKNANTGMSVNFRHSTWNLAVLLVTGASVWHDTIHAVSTQNVWSSLSVHFPPVPGCRKITITVRLQTRHLVGPCPISKSCHWSRSTSNTTAKDTFVTQIRDRCQCYQTKYCKRLGDDTIRLIRDVRLTGFGWVEIGSSSFIFRLVFEPMPSSAISLAAWCYKQYYSTYLNTTY